MKSVNDMDMSGIDLRYKSVDGSMIAGIVDKYLNSVWPRLVLEEGGPCELFYWKSHESKVNENFAEMIYVIWDGNECIVVVENDMENAIKELMKIHINSVKPA